jgi:hypothetical protein
MGRYEVTARTARFEEVRNALERIRVLLDGPTVNLIGLGKAYQALATAIEAATSENGPPSLRFRAVVKALDLRTPKSSLESFVEE